MKQLSVFIKMLNNRGVETILNWSHDVNIGKVFHYTFKVNGQLKTGIFHVFGNGNGYELFMNTNFVTFGEDLDLILK